MRFYIGLALLIVLPKLTFAQYEPLKNKTYVERYEHVDTMYSNADFWKNSKDEVYSIVDDIKKVASETSDRELFLEARLIREAYNVNTGVYGVERFIDSAIVVLKEAERYDIQQLKIRQHYVLSVMYFKVDNFSKAFEHQIKYYNMLQHVTVDEFPFKKRCIAHIGGIYYSFEDYETAKKYLLEAEPLKSSYSSHDNIDLYNTLGLVMREQGKYDSALYYFNKGLNETKKQHNTNWGQVLSGNIGIIYYLQGKYDEAIGLLKTDIENGLNKGHYEGITNSVIKLADIYRAKGKNDSCRYYMKLGRELADKTWHPYQYLTSLFQLCSDFERQLGNKDKALMYADSLSIAKDSLTDRKKVLLLARAQRKVEIERHTAEVKMIVTEKELSIARRNNLILILSMSTIIGLLLLNRQNIRRRRIVAEKDLADTKLSNAQKRLDDFTRTIHEKNQLLETSEHEIAQLQEKLNGDSEEELPHEVLNQLQRSTLLTDSDWDEFRELFEQVHLGFLYRLKEKVPTLTPAETRFIALSKLRFDNKEMANMLGISHSSVRNYKHRLRSKIDITDDASLQEFIDTI